VLVPSPRSLQTAPWRQWLDIFAIGLWGAVLLTFWRTRQLGLLIHPAFNGLVVGAGLLLLVVFFSSALVIVRSRRSARSAEEDGAANHTPVLPAGMTGTLLLVAALMALVVPPKPFTSTKVMARGGPSETLIATRANPQAFRSNAKPEDRTLLEWVRTIAAYPEPDAYGGQRAVVSGFVLRSDELPTGYFWLARFAITCCAADAYPITLTAKMPPGRAIPPNDTWLQVSAEAKSVTWDDRRQVAFQIETVKEIPAPKNPYDY
jgi:uncharacterized repeat protein (TIGR03943 family)